jgi:hypothetical protein
MNYQPNAPFGFFRPPVVKRKAFFSFHYDDIMRVNNARMTGTLKNPAASAMRTFYDGSLWESRKLQGPEALKQLIRDGVKETSAVCVLIGTHTWGRRWVRYEIARAVIDNRGLSASTSTASATISAAAHARSGRARLIASPSARSSLPASTSRPSTTCLSATASTGSDTRTTRSQSACRRTCPIVPPGW